MSAMAVVFQSDRVHVLTDGAFYDSEGVLTTIGNKIWVVPGLNAVFSSRGSQFAFPAFQLACETAGFQTFDDLVLNIADLFAIYDRLVDGLPGEIMLVGWSEARERPEMYFRYTHGKHLDGLSPGSTYLFLQGVVHFGLGDIETPDASLFEPSVDALPAFDAGRRLQVDLRCGEGSEPLMGYSIGGCLTHVELTPSTAAGSVLHYWPDRPGELINPITEEQAVAA